MEWVKNATGQDGATTMEGADQGIIQKSVDPDISCATCRACCCRLEVMIISDTGVPERHIAVDEWGGETMLRLEDGYCSALNRDTFMCTIYENRPWICREFEMGSYECREERAKG